MRTTMLIAAAIAAFGLTACGASSATTDASSTASDKTSEPVTLSAFAICDRYQDALDEHMTKMIPEQSAYEAFADEITETAELADEDIAANLEALAYASRHKDVGDPLDAESRWLDAAQRVVDSCEMAGAGDQLR